MISRQASESDGGRLALDSEGPVAVSQVLSHGCRTGGNGHRRRTLAPGTQFIIKEHSIYRVVDCSIHKCS